MKWSSESGPPTLVARWAPPAALSVATSAATMGLASLAPAGAEWPVSFAMALSAVWFVGRAAGGCPAIATLLLCGAWLGLRWRFIYPDQGWALAATWLAATAAAGLAAALVSRRQAWARPALESVVDQGSERGLLLLLGLATILPFALYGALGFVALKSAYEETGLRLERVARAAQEHASRVLDTNELLLGWVLDLVGTRSDEEVRRVEAALHERLVAMTAPLPQLQSIWVENASGHPILTNRFKPAPTWRVDVSDRDFFVWHREGRGGMHISEPSIGRATNEPFFDTSRRRDDVEGGFAGIVHASLKPGYFASFYADLAQAEPGLTVSLLRSDGLLLARHPTLPSGSRRSDPADTVMRRVTDGARAGLVTMSSSFDGRNRLIAFRALGNYPMFVAAGVEDAIIVRGWRQDMALLAALLFPISGALVAAAWLALQRARRERAALARVRVEVEQRLKAEGALLRNQKLQALGQITGSVAHDFNNLLAVVNNSAHVILRRPPGTDAHPQAAAIERAVRSGVHLTRQLLAFSRRQALRPVELDLRQTLPRTLELLRTGVSGRIEVQMDVAPDLRTLRIDPADLDLALLNLVLNAKDAMPHGGHVRIRAANVAGTDNAQWVVITVADDGTGIPSDVLEQMFEPFFTTKSDTNGTGLGLSQVRAACEQAGGTATIASRVGEGTTVTLRLPAVTRAPWVANFGTDEKRLDCRVLLVEDEIDVAETTRALLETLGAGVAWVTSADEALDALAQAPERHDVVLSDVAMPGAMNGLGLARRLRELRPDLPVVLITGFTGDIDTILSEGFSIVPKPCDPAVLSQALSEAFETVARKRSTVGGATKS